MQPSDGKACVMVLHGSSLVIEEMRGKTRESCPSMQWKVMDVTKMDFLVS